MLIKNEYIVGNIVLYSLFLQFFWMSFFIFLDKRVLRLILTSYSMYIFCVYNSSVNGKNAGGRHG